MPRKRRHSETSDPKEGEAANESQASTDQTPEGSQDKSSCTEAKKKKNRCAVCRKKVGLTGFDCRCGGLFCSTHRYTDKHECTFDYKEMGAKEIRKNNPVVVREKIKKI